MQERTLSEIAAHVGGRVCGAPAINASQTRRAHTMLQCLPDMRQDIRNLQSRLRKIAASVRGRPDAAEESQNHGPTPS